MLGGGGRIVIESSCFSTQYSMNNIMIFQDKLLGKVPENNRPK